MNSEIFVPHPVVYRAVIGMVFNAVGIEVRGVHHALHFRGPRGCRMG